jgi:site-specific DNA recombinase
MIRMNEKAGIWLRVSSGKQDEASQLPDCQAWCESHGYATAETYQVHGRSAYKGNKQFDLAWDRALADMKAGRISVLVVWKQDRIDRKLATFQMLREVVDAGSRVEFVTQPHLNDLTTMGGRISLKVQEEIAYAESHDKSDRIRAKHAALFAANSLVGKPPYGFTVGFAGGVKTMVPVPEQAELIRAAVERYLSGESLRKVCAWLDDEGAVPPSGRGSWSPVSLSQVFRNESLIGRRMSEPDKAGHRRTVLRHAAILDQATWDRLQAELDRKASRTGVTPAGTAMLTGVAVCAKCGGPVYRIDSGNKRKDGTRKQHMYYRCHGTDRAPSTCANMVELDELDGWVSARMLADTDRVIETVVVPGAGYDDEIADVKRDMAEAVHAEQFDRMPGLQARLASLRALPARAPEVREFMADYTHGDLWARMETTAERRAYLLARGIRVRVEKGTEPVMTGTGFDWPALAELARLYEQRVAAGEIPAEGGEL